MFLFSDAMCWKLWMRMKQNFFSGKFIYTEINLKDIFTVNSRNVFKNLKINIYGFSYFSSFSNIKFVHFCDTFFRHREVFSGCKKIVLKSTKVKIFRIKWVILVIFWGFYTCYVYNNSNEYHWTEFQNYWQTDNSCFYSYICLIRVCCHFLGSCMQKK